MGTLLCFIAVSTNAANILGGHIAYECLGGDEYEITLTIYKDCFGASDAPPQESMFFFPEDCGSLPFSALLTLVSDEEISDLCDSELANSSCNGGFNAGAQQLTYTTIVNLSDECEWTMEWFFADWNYFENMDTTPFTTALLTTTFDASVAPCGASVVPNAEFPVNYSCFGDPVSYTVEVDNPSNYDLQFSFTCPLTDDGDDAPLNVPCNEPIPGIALDPATGVITFDSPDDDAGNYVAGVLIEMFDNGVLVGSMLETVTFTVRTCELTPTIMSDPLIQTIEEGGSIVAPDEVFACVGDTLCFTIEATNSNLARAITFTTDFTTLFPDASFEQNGINPASGNFCILVDETMVGSTVITVDVEDDQCPDPNEFQVQLTLTVSPTAVLNINDAVICFGESIDLTATGDTQFNWAVVSGDNSVTFAGNGANQTISPEFDTQIEVVSANGDPTCVISDEAFIEVSLSELDFDLTDETCAGNDGAIELTVSGGSGNYSYDWPGIPSALPSPDGLTGGDYTVTVSDDDLPGCTRSETVTLDSTPPPFGEIDGDATICEGGCADIAFAFSGTNPFTVNLRNETTGVLEATGTLEDGDTFQVCPTTTTTYTLELVTDSNTPACTYDIPSAVTITVLPTVTAGFIAPDPICEGDDLLLEVSIDLAGGFELEFTPAGGVPASGGVFADGDVITFADADAGAYEVTAVSYVDAPFCAGNTLDAVNLTVNPLPTATITDEVTICADEEVSLIIELTGTGPWLVEHDYAAEPSPLAIATSPFTWELADPLGQSETITLTQVTDEGTDCVATINEVAEINVNALPDGEITSDATLCFDEAFDLTFELSGEAPFTIEWNDGTTTFTEVDVNDGFEVEVNPDASTTYCLELVTDANGCEFEPTSCVTLTVIPAATVDFAEAGESICEGDCVEVPFDFVNGAGPWTVTLELTDTDGTTTETIVLNDGETFDFCPTSETDIVIVEAIDQATDCAADLSAAGTYEITSSVIPLASLSGSFEICEGECADLEIAFTDVTGPLNITVGGVDYNNINPATDLVNGVFTIEVCPIADTDYALTFFEDLGNECAEIDEDLASVAVFIVPDAAFVDGLVLCEGETGTLVFDITSGGPVNLEIEVEEGGDVSTVNLDGLTDGGTFEVTPSETATYTILSVVDPASTATCFSNPDDVATVIVNTAPVVSQVDTLCALTATSYELQFVISSGDPASYTVSQPGTLEDFNGGPEQLFTSDPLIPEDGAVFIIDDANGCAPVTITIDPFECPSITDAGTVDTTPITLCDEGILSVTPNGDEVLDPNDVLSFIIHSDPGAQLGVVFYISDAPQWDIETELDFPGTLQYGETYYISAVAADDDGSGIADLGADIVSVSVGMPFTILETPTATLSGGETLCDGESTDLVIDFTGDGPFTVALALDGVEVADSPFGPTNESQIVVSVAEAGTYSLLSVENDICPGTVDGTAEVIVNPLPEALLTGGGLLCDGETLELDIELEGTGDWLVTIGQDTDGDGTANNTFDVPFTQAVDVYEVTEGGDWFVVAVTDATTCLNDVPGNPVNVDLVPVPEAEFVNGDVAFCEGTSVDISIEFSGNGPWNLTYELEGVPTTIAVNEADFELNLAAPGTLCLVEVDDANACTNTLNSCIEITEVPIPDVFAGDDAELCVGDVITLGEAEVPGYVYTWDPAENLSATDVAQPSFTAPVVDVQESFTFTLEVESDGCFDTDEVTLTVNPLPAADAGDEVTICAGADVQLEATGGVTYQWTDNGTFLQGGVDTPDPVVTPDATTVYEVEVTDDNTCSAIANVTVNVIETPEAELTGGATLCAGESTDLTITFSGTGPYTFGWAIDGVEAANSPFGPTEDPVVTIPVNETGEYTLLFVENEVCDGNVSGSADVLVNPIPSGALTGGGALCDGETLDLDVTLSGTPDFTVTFGQDTDNDGQANNTFEVTFDELDAIYTVSTQGDWFIVSIEDDTGCINDDQGAPVSVEVVPLPEVNFAFGDTSYCEGASVDITLILSGEAPWDVEYELDGVPNTITINASPFDLNIAEPGTLCLVEVSDANACDNTLDACIDIIEVPIPVADAGETETLCVNDTYVLGAPEVPGYTYLWEPADNLSADNVAQPTFTAPELDQATPFSFTVTVTASGCSSIDDVTIAVNPLPLADAGDEGFICQGDEFELNATGGVAYAWTDNGTFNQGGLDTPNPVVEPLVTTDYEVLVTDANDCSATAVVSVTVAEAIDAEVDATEALCFGDCDGFINVTPSGGFGDYTIAWDPAQPTDFELADLCPDTYAFTITDTNGCTFEESVTIEENDEYTINDITVNPTPCFGSADGEIIVDSPEAVEFILGPDSVSNATGVFDGLPAGFYTVIAIDAFGCETSETVDFEALSAPITMSVDFDEQEVCVNDEVALNATALGGDGNFTYAWYADEPPAAIASNDNPYNITVADEQTFFVIATDGNGCNSDTLSSTVFFPNPIQLDLLSENFSTICLDECFDLAVEVSGGTGNYELEWISSATGQQVISTESAFTDCPVAAGVVTYVFTVNDGCVLPAVQEVGLNVLPIPEPLFATDVNDGCWPVEVQFVNLTDTAGVDFQDCLWDFGNGATTTSCDTVTFVYDTPGSYTPSLTVTADNGCAITIEFDGTIDVFDYPEADFTWSPVTTLETTTRLTNLSSADAVFFDWQVQGVGQSDLENPSFDLPPVDASSWLACLTVENIHGCADSVCYFIDMTSEILVYVPNAFTPDNDGLNELFVPVVGGGVADDDYLFTVWNRWGEKVFETDRIGEGWNGAINRGEYYTQIDAYVWAVEYREVDSGNIRLMRGHVMVIR